MGAFFHMTGRNEEELCWLNKKDSDFQELAESAGLFCFSHSFPNYITYPSSLCTFPYILFCSRRWHFLIIRQFVSDIQQCKILANSWTTVWFWIIHYVAIFLQIRSIFLKTSKRICFIEPLWSKPFKLSVVLAIKKMQQKNMNSKIHWSAFILQPIFKRLYQDAEHFQIDLFCQEKTFHVLDFSIFESSQLQFNKIFPTWVTQFT